MYANAQSIQKTAAAQAIGLGSIGTDRSPDRPPELPTATERLSSTLARLYDVADRLDNRLTGVVARPHGPSQEPSIAKAAMNTGLGSQLDEMNDRAMVIESRIAGLLDRLEF